MDITLPKNWNQLSSQQLEWLQTIYMQKIKSESVFLSVAFMGLAGIVVEKKPCMDGQAYVCHLENNKKSKFLLRPYEIVCFSQSLKWLLKECTLNRCPYPELKYHGIIYKSPSTKLSDFSWKQYKVASDFYTLYIRSVQRKRENPEYFYRFIATLFTPKRMLFNDRTQKLEPAFLYSVEQSENWTVFSENLLPVQANIIKMFWEGCMQYLSSAYPGLFKPAGKHQKTGSREDMLKMEGCTMAVVMDRLKISEQEVNTCSMFTILNILETMKMESEKQKEHITKMKNFKG